MRSNETPVGDISLRLGATEFLVRFAGQVAYGVHPEHRGHHYAARALRLILPLARQHGFAELWITCNPDNVASRRTCELVGAELVETVDLPSDCDMYAEGERQKCRYRLVLDSRHLTRSLRAMDLTLIEAVRAKNAGAVRAAIAAGADPNVVDSRPLVGAGNTPLHDAANGGDGEIVAILLAQGADVDARCESGWTPLMRACNRGDLEVTRLLLEAGADPHATNREGYTAYGRIPGTCPQLRALMRRFGPTDAG